MEQIIQVLKLTKHTDTGKLAGFRSLNTSVEKNTFCTKMRAQDSICKSCYAANMEKAYKGLRVNIQANGDMLSSRILDTHELPRINELVFRFHSTGELMNEVHMVNFINIALDNPRTRFVLWTKRKDIVNKTLAKRSLPDNFKLIFSNAKVDSKDIKLPKHFTKIFSVYSKKNPVEAKINCHSKCQDCMVCYTDNSITHIRELIK
jgi:hypothetical protein